MVVSNCSAADERECVVRKINGYPECKTILSMNSNGEVKAPEEDVIVEEKCEKCQGQMVLKTGPYGKYIECKECKNRKKHIVSTGVKCPKCGEGDIIEKKSKYGKVFYGCNKYPTCDFALWDAPTGDKCPKCGELLTKKIGKNGDKIVCSNRKCDYKIDAPKPEEPIETEE